MAAALTPRRAYLGALTLVLLVIFLAHLAGRGEFLPAGDLDRLPLRIGEWRGENIPVSERERAVLGTENLLLRLYRKGEGLLYLYILESASNRATFHPPEYCYVGGRTELVERGRAVVRWEGGEVPAHRMVFLGPRGKSLVYYWYAFGDRILGSYYRQQLLVIAANLLRRPRPALLIRVSTEGVVDPARGDELITDFARSALPAIERYLLEDNPPTDH